MNATQGFAHPEFLIECDALERQLGEPNLRVLDCTTHLIPDPKITYQIVPGRADFEKGHIPGAQFVDLQGDLSDKSHRFRFMLPSAEDFAAAMSRFGVGEGTRVVLYSTANPWWATRVWWLLRVFGFDDAAVLNGGWQKWSREGRPVETGPAKPRAPGHFAVREQRPLMAGKEEVLQAVGDGAVCTVNALLPEQHAGTGGNSYGRRGRIKGSVNLPAAHLIDPKTNEFLPAAELRERFEAIGAFDKRVITYCGGGIAASADALALVMLGHPEVRLYDASLGEWATDPEFADGNRLMSYTIIPLSEHTGAEVRGIDLTRPVDDETRAHLNDTFVERSVLVLRDQHLTPQQLLAAVGLFGEVFPQHNSRFALPECPLIHYISNQDLFPDGRRYIPGEGYHTDHSNAPYPPKATVLHAVSLPDRGGDTQYVNMQIAYDELPEETKRRLDGLKAAHVYQSRHSARKLMALNTEASDRVPEAVTHPVVRTHPESGRKAIYINPIRIEGIVGMAEADALALLADLLEHATQPKYQYRHHWQSGDLVMWDNRSLLHKANGDYDMSQLRYLYRVMLQGDRPA